MQYTGDAIENAISSLSALRATLNLSKDSYLKARLTAIAECALALARLMEHVMAESLVPTIQAGSRPAARAGPPTTESEASHPKGTSLQLD